MKRRGYELVGYAFDGAEAVEAGGVATVTFGPVEAGVLWRIELLAVSASAGTPIVDAFAGDAAGTNLIAHTIDGIADVIYPEHPIVIVSGQVLRVRWSGAGIGAASTCSARIHYRIEEQVFESPDLGIGPLVEACRELVDELRRSRV